MTAQRATLRLRFDARAPYVVLRATPRGSDIYEDYRLTHGEARRLAWSILADLAPDELEMDVERAMELLTACGADPAPLVAAARGQPISPTMTSTLLHGLSRGALTTAQAAELIERDSATAASLLRQLAVRGRAKRIDGGAAGEKALYAITAAGWGVIELAVAS